jgi:hypothetical protein
MFLDREPYIRFWRPFYHRFGPIIRRGKNFLSEPKVGQARSIEQRLASLEVANQQTCSTLEQILISIVQDRQITTAVETLQKALAEGLATQTAQMNANNAIQWAAIERLLVSMIGTSIRQSPQGERIERTNSCHDL